MASMGALPLMHLCGTLNAEILIELKFIHFRLLEMSFDWVNVLFYKMKFYTQGDVNFHGQIKFSPLDYFYFRFY